MLKPFVIGLAVGALTLTQAFAAAPQTLTDKTVASAPSSKTPPQTDKHAACEKTWKAQTKHTGKHKAFIAACVAKG